MHFLTLVPVTVPAQEPDPLKDVLVQATLMELRKKSESDPKDFMAKIFASELTGKVTPFGRAVFDAVYEKMDPYAVETDHPACREFVDCTDEIREEYRTGTIDCVRLADGTVVERFDPRFRNRFSVKDGRIVQNDFGPLHHKKRSKKAKKMTWLPNYPNPSRSSIAPHGSWPKPTTATITCPRRMHTATTATPPPSMTGTPSAAAGPICSWFPRIAPSIPSAITRAPRRRPRGRRAIAGWLPPGRRTSPGT